MIHPAAPDPRWPTPLRGYVVAGGQSSRMGRDKARIPYGGTTLIEHAIALARQVTPEVRLLCGPKRRYEEFDVPVIEDPVCGVGPLGGLYGALLSASVEGRERMFWLAVDLPLVTLDVLTGLTAGLDRADVVMARTPRGPEPLCAAFRTEPALVAVRRALLEGRLKLTSAFEGLLVHTLESEAAAFANINTPGDYDRLGRH
jgi:molybdopterin-guanine dinucleotide biosynthesis protein A